MEKEENVGSGDRMVCKDGWIEGMIECGEGGRKSSVYRSEEKGVREIKGRIRRGRLHW